GTNTLPFLLAHIKHRESTIKYKLAPLFWKHQFLKLPSYLRYPYHDTSILALYALGSNATPILPELSKLFEEHSTADGRLSLLGIGTDSIPTLIKLCQSANAEVRIEAAITMATMKANPPPSFEWSWGADPVNHRSIFLIMTSI